MRPATAAAMLFLLVTATARASGWHDYTLDIAPGFAVVRTNSFDVCLGTSDNKALICPSDHPGTVGPLDGYVVTPDRIWTRHQGVKPNESNATMSAGDPARHVFFVVSRSDRSVVGPLSAVEFSTITTRSPHDVAWTAPRNPNFWRPLSGSVTFIAYAIVILLWPALLVFAVVGWWLWTRRRRAGRAARARRLT